MGEVVLLDTNGWIALLNSRDHLHRTAAASWAELGRRGCRIIVTDWVIAETGNGLARTPARSQFRNAVSRIQASARADIVHIDGSRLDGALRLYESRSDKMWGLIDCASFVVMREFAITVAFTSDQHFQQAGFRCELELSQPL